MTQPRVIQVTDQLERRIRKPVDALRCIMSCIWIFVLAVAAVAASATTTGVETDIVGASRRLPHALLAVAPPIALFALLILPVALAVSQLVRRQVRRLIEAVATGLLAGAVAEVANIVLSRPAAARLYYAIIMSRPGVSHVNALDPYLAGLVAYATMIGLAGRPAWRNALGLAIGVYAIVQLAASHTTVLSILITLLAGRAIGLAVRYGAGSASQRPPARDIAAALSAGDLAVTAIRRVRQAGPGVAGSRHYAVATQDGSQLDVVVFDRDQQAAGAFYRLYRWIRVQGQVSRTAPLSVDRTVERRALLSYATEDAGVPTPRLRTLVRVGPDAAVLAYDHCEGTTLAQRNPGCTDAELGRIWDAVTRLHAHHVTHRGLTADRIMFTADGQVMLLDPGDGDVAASDLQIRLDLAQLIAELALFVGPEKSAGLAVEKVGGERAGGRAAAAAAGRARPVHQAGAAPPARCPAGRPQGAAGGRARRRGHAGAAGAHPAAHPGDAGRQRRRHLPAGRRARPGQPRERAAIGGLALGPRGAGAVGGDLRGRGAVAVRVRRRAAELPPHSPRPAGQLLRHAGDACRRRGRRAERPVPAAQEDPGAGRGGQRRRVPGGGLRPAHPAACRVRRDRGNRDRRARSGRRRGPTSWWPGS